MEGTMWRLEKEYKSTLPWSGDMLIQQKSDPHSHGQLTTTIAHILMLLSLTFAVNYFVDATIWTITILPQDNL